jgi:hypothetical protein
VGLQRELDPVERPADHRHVAARHTVPIEACGGQGEQVRVGAGSAVEHRLVWQRDERRSKIWQERRVWVARQEVDDARRDDRSAARSGRDPWSDGGPEPACTGDEPPAAQFPVRGSDGGSADPAMGRERPDGGQTRSGSELTVADAALDALRDLRRSLSGDVITYRYVHRFVS